METPSFSDKGWWEFLNLPEEKPTYSLEHGGIEEPGTMDPAAIQTAALRHVHFQSQSSVESYPWPPPTCEMQQEQELLHVMSTFNPNHHSWTLKKIK